MHRSVLVCAVVVCIMKIGVLAGKKGTFKDLFQKLGDKLSKLEKRIERKPSCQSDGSSTMYTRWGKTTCPQNKTELVYSGFVGGSHYTHKGGAAEHLCLPKNPDWGKYSDSASKYIGYIYGTEYETWENTIGVDASYGQWEVPCAVCRTVGSSNVIMIPGKNICMDSWTKQYSGYLMTGRHDYPAPSQYICVDKDADKIGSSANMDGKLLFAVEARCGSLKCPPYVNRRELTCVVCTK